ncbi:MAG: hypothetical protein K9M02_19990 [Thiohalocapsa sp.]|nr:hypothetical protein [Thiohalocapsa sp.]
MPQSVRFLVAGCCLALLLPAAARAGGVPVYDVDVDDALQRLRVTVCFGGEPPRMLHAEDERASRYLLGTRANGLFSGRLRPLPSGAGTTMPVRPDDRGCVRYDVDLSRDSDGGFGALFLRRGGAVVLSPHAFLWYPADAGEVEVRFRLPAGFEVSTPWQPIGGGARAPAYRTGARPPSWDARIAIGALSSHAIALPGGRLDVALLPGSPPADPDMLLRWLRRSGEALVSAHGRLPSARVQVLVVPLGSGREPVPWGEVQRGGGDAVHLYIDQRRSEQAFLDDWVLVHELSHLLHPPMRGSGRWLYEGLASYYQNVLRARAGLLDEATAWTKLHAGFRRGMAQTKRGRTLAEAARNMPWTREYMRVYWSGAAIALLADLELRRTSGGMQSLDTVLGDLARCCLPADRKWTDREVVDKLDSLSQTEVFGRLYRRWLDSDRFPDLTAAYRTLGLEAPSDKDIRFVGGAAERESKRAIMAGGGSTDPR